MKIVSILGSPKKHGNTDAVLRRFEALAAAEGHTVERMNVVDFEMDGCLGCDACQEILDDLGCARNDGASDLLESILHAGLVIYAAPVYCWSLPAQLKVLFDRHYCTVKWQGGEVATALMAGKRCALLLTCGGDAATNADLTLPMFERQMKYIRGIVAGMYVLDNCTSPLADAARASSLAGQMARELLGAGSD